MSEQAEAAWLTYRDDYLRKNPWCDPRRAARQMRKRDFVAGFLLGQTTPPTDAAEAAGGADHG